MGDPHYNTWGGKHNSWGNRNRKPKGNSGSERVHYEPNKLFNTLAGGALIFILGAGGLNAAKTLVSGMFETKNKVESVKETVEKVENAVSNDSSSEISSEGSGSGSGSGSSLTIDKVASKIVNKATDFDENDVADALDYIYDYMQTGKIESVTSDVHVVDYEDVDKESKFKKHVLKELDPDVKQQIFVVYDESGWSQDEAVKNAEALQEIIGNCEDGLSEVGFYGKVKGSYQVLGGQFFEFYIYFIRE